MMANTLSFTERVIAHLPSNISMAGYLIVAVLCVIIVISLIILLLIKKQNKIKKFMENADFTDEKTNKKNIKRLNSMNLLSFIAVIFIIGSVIIINTMTDTYHTAYKHGYRGGYFETASSLWNSIHLSPVEDKIPDDDTQKLFICYRFACPDCEAIYNELQNIYPQGTSNIYWIASRSKQGKALLEKYPINEVPSAIYVKKDGTYITYVLYKKTKDGSVIDTQNIEALKKAMEQDAKL